jgi:hypothetical protein
MKNNIQSNTPSNTPSNYTSNSSSKYLSNNTGNIKESIAESVEDFERIEENDSYPINTQHSNIENEDKPYNTINTKRTFEYNKKGILAKIIPEPIPINNQEKIIKIDQNPRIESFAPIDQLLVTSPYTESNYINQLDFPENTSDELPIFNADTVSQIYNVDNITSLYNTINSDIYKGYKTIDFI